MNLFLVGMDQLLLFKRVVFAYDSYASFMRLFSNFFQTTLMFIQMPIKVTQMLRYKMTTDNS